MSTFPNADTRPIPEKIFREGHRVWDKTHEDEKGCWRWTGQTSNGRWRYGRIEILGYTYAAHRVAFELVNGRGSAAGWLVLHRCDVRLCVNPGHLFLGSDQDNAVDRVSKGRGKRKLDGFDVLQIRDRLTKGWDVSTLASTFEVTRANIRAIRDGKTWKHLIPDRSLPRDLFDGQPAMTLAIKALEQMGNE